MKRLPSWTQIIFALGVFLPHAFPCSAQSSKVVGTRQNGVVLTRLSPPVYPPIALTAHIEGDVELLLNIRRDGGVESAVVISGPPLLHLAALSSAKQSQFECLKCTEDSTAYHLFYTFQLVIPAFPPCTDDLCGRTFPAEHGPEVVLSGNHVTLTSEPSVTCICDYSRKVRALKCLYLWRCGIG
jgi:Gram-negative bacterial TonB protein C-terminal